MSFERFVYLVPYFISAAISLGVSIYAFRRREFSGAIPLAWLALLEAEWTLTFIGQALSTSLEGKLFWNNAQFLGAIFSPLAYLAFVLNYTHRRIPNPRLTLRLAAIVPLLILAVVWTDALHGLWRVAPHLEPATPFDVLIFTDGPLFMLYPLFGYTTLIFATFLLLLNFFATPRIYRFQIGAVLAGIAFPWVVTMVAILNLTPWPLHEATPIAFAFSNALVAWALFRFGLFNIVPVARELLIENLRDGVIVLDNAQRVVDFNQVARLLIQDSTPSVIGKSLDAVWPFLAAQIRSLGEKNHPKGDIDLQLDGENRAFEITVSPLGKQTGSHSGQLVTLRDITDQKRFEAVLQKMAITDPLTGLFNRRQFFDLVEHELERSRRYKHSMSMILLDIDDFKRVNDHYGHRVGDQVLKTIAQTLNAQLRDSDTIARYGGEEFIVLLPETDALRAFEAAERLRLIAANCSVDTGRGTVQVTISLGVVCLLPSDEIDVDQMLERADHALYTAKNNGRNQACMWENTQDSYSTYG